jgi:hypothetical protein
MPKYLTRESKGVVIIHDKAAGNNRRLYEVKHDDSYGGPAWKLDVGAECNRMLNYADSMEPMCPTSPFQDIPKTIRSIVARVASFEELEVENE